MAWKDSLIAHDDDHSRCGWCGLEPVYVTYHDTEWGVPEWDDRALFEKLLLDGFQAGLSWITILKKRDAFREAFDDFEPSVMARYDADKKAELMQNAGIVRNRLKIEASVTNAQSYLGYDDWRLPNVKQLQSLVDYGTTYPALPSGHPFVDVQVDYWSSTSVSPNNNPIPDPSYKYFVEFGTGYTYPTTAAGLRVWPVRAPE